MKKYGIIIVHICHWKTYVFLGIFWDAFNAFFQQRFRQFRGIQSDYAMIHIDDAKGTWRLKETTKIHYELSRLQIITFNNGITKYYKEM